MLRNEGSETYVEIRNTITLIEKGQINDLAFLLGYNFNGSFNILIIVFDAVL